MKQITIKCNKADWDLSLLTASGLERNGRLMDTKFTAIIAKDLPDVLKEVWHAAVEHLKEEGKGEWFASTVQVLKREEPQGDIVCKIESRYPDHTIDRSIITFNEAPIISFFDSLTDESFWPTGDDEQ